jgi:acetyl/propionyl-CoA carboxylase alpha subunit
LSGSGLAADVDIGGFVAAAQAHGCTHVHPGYGLLSENAGFAPGMVTALTRIERRPVVKIANDAGHLVGPDAAKTATSLTVPFFVGQLLA